MLTRTAARRTTGLALTSLLALGACSLQDATVDDVDVQGAPDDPASSDPSGLGSKTVEVVGAVRGDGGEWLLDVPTWATSVLLVARGQAPTDTVSFDTVVAPDGTDVMETLAFPENQGEVSLLLPRFVEDPDVAGRWRLRASSENGLDRIEAVVKGGDPDVGTQVLDVTAWVVTDHPDLDRDRRDDLLAGLRATAMAAFGPHSLGVGTLTFVDAPDDVRERHAEVFLPTSGDDLAQRALCAEMDEAIGPETLHLAIVDRVVDPEDHDGQTEGNAAGIPGAAGLAGTSTSCVIVIADGDRPLEQMIEVVWHEAGHLLGLPHTTEAEGDAFDFFLDTPECEVDDFDEDGDAFVDADECADADADLLMFHDGDGLRLSDEQAWLLRRHPLFRPAT